jgi:hypothetical protein
LKDQASSYDGTESRSGAEIDATDYKDNKGVKEECIWWNTKALVNLPYILREDEGIVTGKGKRQARGGLLAGVESEHPSEKEKDDENRGSGLGLGRLVPNLIDRDSGWSAKYRIEV